MYTAIIRRDGIEDLAGDVEQMEARIDRCINKYFR